MQKDSIRIKKKTASNWIAFSYKHSTAYVCKKYLTENGKRHRPSKKSTTGHKDSLYRYHGRKLSKRAGVIYGPSGKESYYNLRMSRIVKNMLARGYKGKYWVRADGVKMFGDYVMVAANLRIRPFGTHVKTSRGMGIVVDTGTFAYYNKRQLDIAVTW